MLTVKRLNYLFYCDPVIKLVECTFAITPLPRRLTLTPPDVFSLVVFNFLNPALRNSAFLKTLRDTFLNWTFRYPSFENKIERASFKISFSSTSYTVNSEYHDSVNK